jgi:integrase
VTEGHIKEVDRALQKYKKYILFKLDYKKSIQYFNKLQRESSISYYKKQMYQILKFLKHLKCDWAEDIKLPKNPVYTPTRFSLKNIDEILRYFKDNTHFLQIKSLILLGSTTGLRAEELYQLNPETIKID